jgi:CheY-like chemotaxis protein
MRELRHALRNLYNLDELRGSSLVDSLTTGDPEGPLALQRALMSAIEALDPGRNVSHQSAAWRNHHTLSSRYIRQFQQSEVARTLGLGLRQMRRQERLALRVLAEYLRTRHGRQQKVAGPPAPSLAAVEPVPADAPTLSREEELQWLQESEPCEPVAIVELVRTVLSTVSPLARALDVRLEPSLPGELPGLVAQLATLRQAFLNVLTAAIRSVPGGSVQIALACQARQVRADITPVPPASGPRPRAEDQAESIGMARQLVALSGGSLAILPGNGSFVARLVLPAAEGTGVLVIDDNADALLLFQRYLAGTRYAFIGVREPEQALALAQKARPRLVVLDIMLPGVDGWELLGRLREHPALLGVPIVVCSILPQEQLALTLGAAAFIRKPVGRADLLAVLGCQLGRASQESHT